MEPYNDAAVEKIEERVDDHRRFLNTAEKRLDEQDKRLVAPTTACTTARTDERVSAERNET